MGLAWGFDGSMVWQLVVGWLRGDLVFWWGWVADGGVASEAMDLFWVCFGGWPVRGLMEVARGGYWFLSSCKFEQIFFS